MWRILGRRSRLCEHTIGLVLRSQFTTLRSTQLHRKSTIEEEIGNELRFLDVFYNHVAEKFFSKALIMKISGDKLISIWSFQRQDLLAHAGNEIPSIPHRSVIVPHT